MTAPRFALSLMLAVYTVLQASIASAQHLRMGLETVSTTADPHLYLSVDGRTLAFHSFEPLVANDGSMQPSPALALAWELEGERRWTFKLRTGVRFHDGREFTAVDAVYTFCRIIHLPGSGFLGALQGIVTVSAADPHTLVIETDRPTPLLPRNLSSIGIIPSEPGWSASYQASGCGGASWPDPSAFDRGEVPGTGPYKLSSFAPGGRITFTRNDNYWGPPPPWRTVEIAPLPDAGTRNRSLIRGDSDIINQVSPESMAFLSEQRNIRVETGTRARSIYLGVNLGPGRAGTQSTPNPLADVRVRRAISLAVDRTALSDRLMPGMAGPANQFIPPGMAGFVDGVRLPFDVQEAKRLLSEAGFPNGFETSLTAVEPFARLAEGISRYLAAIGIRLKINFVHPGEFIDLMNRQEYRLVLVSSVPFSGDLSYIAREIFASADPGTGMGMQNFGGYVNARMDELIGKALVTTEGRAREALLKQVTGLALEDLPFIPLLHVSRAWAMRSDLRYEARADGHTLAQLVRPSGDGTPSRPP